MANAFAIAETAGAPNPTERGTVCWVAEPGSQAHLAVRELRRLTPELKRIQTVVDAHKDVLKTWGTERLATHCVQYGTRPESAQVGVESGECVALVVQERAAVLDAEDVERVRVLAGADQAADLVTSSVSIRIEPTVLEERTVDGSQTVYEWLGKRLDASLRRAVKDGAITEAQRARLIVAERKTVAAKGWMSRVAAAFQGQADAIREFFGVMSPTIYAKV